MRRFLTSALDEALACIAAPASDATVHRLRKALKRARAALALLRTLIPERSRRIAAAALREVAQAYATARDSASLVEALAHFARLHPSASMAGARSAAGRALRARLRRARRTLPDPIRRTALLRELGAVRSGAASWPLGAVGPAGAMDDAASIPMAREIRRIYRRARRARDSAATLHAWRKEVKRFHNALLALHVLMRPAASTVFLKRSDRLGEALGCERDLALLEAAIRAEGRALPVTETISLIGQIRRERKRALSRARRVSAHLFRTRPRKLVHTLGLVRNSGR